MAPLTSALDYSAFFQEYPKLSQNYCGSLECLAQDHVITMVTLFVFLQDYPKLSQNYYGLLECLAQDHMSFISNLEPQVFLYILSTISEGLTALGKCTTR